MLHAAPHTPAVPATITLGWADLLPHRSFLVQTARRRLLDPSLAEDLVHDVFEAVVTGRAVFGGRAALRSWLVAVLKHKIVDLVRQRSGHDSLDSADDDDGDSAAPELVCPQPGPEDVAGARLQLRRVMDRLDRLPAHLRDVVRRRVLHDEDTGTVCQALAISEQNLFVRLHRARRLLAA